MHNHTAAMYVCLLCGLWTGCDSTPRASSEDAGASRTDAATLPQPDAGPIPSDDAATLRPDDALAALDRDTGAVLDAALSSDDAGAATDDVGPGPSEEEGWTAFPTAPDARAVYVSSASGDDAEGRGLTASTPVRTLSRGYALLRSGRGDQLLLRRGETWNETFPSWTKSGASEEHPMLIGTYGEGARPRIRSAGRNAWTATATGVVDHVAIVGLHFDASDRGAHDNPYGVFRTAAGTSFLIEDCLFEQYRVNVSINNDPARDLPIHDVRVRRSVIVDAHPRSEGRSCTVSTACRAASCSEFSSDCAHLNCELTRDQRVGVCIPHSQGLYAANVRGLTIEENVFDANGWRDGVEGGQPTIYNHGMYVQADVSDVVVRGNVFANASSHGAQVRPGGIVEDNLFAGNPIGLSYGYVLGSHTPTEGGVTGVVSGNVVRRGGDIRDEAGFYRGIGLQIGNIESAVMSDNVISHYASRREGGTAIQISHLNGRGIRELTVERNVVFDWCRPLWLEGRPGPDSDVDVHDNVLDARDSPSSASDTPVMALDARAPYPSLADLWVWSARPTDGWYQLGDGHRSLTQLVSTTGAERVREGASAFVDATRDLASFQASLRSPRGASWLAGARLQSRLDWRPGYTGGAVTRYLRAGFERR